MKSESYLLVARAYLLAKFLTAYGLAKKAGLKHVTYLSVYQAYRFLDVPHFAAKHAVEDMSYRHELRDIVAQR